MEYLKNTEIKCRFYLKGRDHEVQFPMRDCKLRVDEDGAIQASYEQHIQESQFIGFALCASVNGVQQEVANISDITDRLPESDTIRQQALEMDEKEFDQWWWEQVYKNR